MRLLLHAASPEGLLMLRAATAAGVLPAATDRVVVFDSRTPGGRAVEAALENGAPLDASDTVLDLGRRNDAWAVLHFLAPSVLVLDAAASTSAQRLARAVPKARVVLLDPGEAQASPTPHGLSAQTLSRVSDLVYADIVPGLAPVLLRERTVGLHSIPFGAIQAVASEWAESVHLPRRVESLAADGVRMVLAIGRELPELKDRQAAESTRLATRQAAVALDTGAGVVVHLPSPGSGRAQEAAIAAAAAQEGIACAQLPTHLPPLVAHALLSPALTVSIDAPLLLLLRSHTNHRVQSIATGRLLPRLAHTTDPARPRLALVDAVLRRGIPLPAEDDSPAQGLLQRIVDAVAFAVDPRTLAALRPEASRTLVRETALRSAYVPRSHVESLQLEEHPLASGDEGEPKPARAPRRAGGAWGFGWLHKAGGRA